MRRMLLLVLPLLLAGPAAAQQTLIREPLPLAGDLAVQMTTVDLKPFAGSPTTAGRPGHAHPGATYVYVLKGAVVSRLGAGPERRYDVGQAWSEKPGEAHYIVNASPEVPAQLLVLFVAPAEAVTMTAPLSGPGATR